MKRLLRVALKWGLPAAASLVAPTLLSRGESSALRKFAVATPLELRQETRGTIPARHQYHAQRGSRRTAAALTDFGPGVCGMSFGSDPARISLVAGSSSTGCELCTAQSVTPTTSVVISHPRGGIVQLAACDWCVQAVRRLAAAARPPLRSARWAGPHRPQCGRLLPRRVQSRRPC
jgi:hypothetical protein